MKGGEVDLVFSDVHVGDNIKKVRNLKRRDEVVESYYGTIFFNYTFQLGTFITPIQKFS